MTQHTKGPWKITQQNRYNERITDVDAVRLRYPRWLTITIMSDEISIQEHNANCRLVAAAPDLLEALEVVVTSMLDSGYNKNSASVLKARAAIALAREGF